MKRFLTVFLHMMLCFTMLTSCGGFTGLLGEDADTNAESAEDSGDKTDDKTNKKPEENKEPTQIQYDNAVLVSYKTADCDYEGPFNSTVGWKAAGMGYIIRTKSGKVIAIDGGHSNDGSAFYSLLKEYTNDNGGVIDYWILTHAHGDHINALKNMVTSGIMKLTVNNFVFDFPTDFNDTNTPAAHATITYLANRLRSNVITPKKDDKIKIDDVEIHFLYTPVNYSSYTSANAISLIFTVETENKKVMITGDAFEPTLKSVANAYKDKLKCDILQMPHHFLCDTGDEAFYNYVGANTLILPTCKAGFEVMTDPNSEYKNNKKFKLNKAVLDAAQTVYKAFDGTVEIKL